MSDTTQLKEMIKNHKSFYQDIVINNEVLAKGMRETCESRWNMIKPYLKDYATYMDIGSDLGYFSSRIAKEMLGSTVVSIEKNTSSCEMQREIMRCQNLTNVMVCNHEMWNKDLEFIVQGVEAIDYVLIFAVMHYYTEEEQKHFLELMSKIVPNIIIEYPLQVGTGEWGGVAYPDIEKFLDDYYESVEVIGNHDFGSEQRVLIIGKNFHIERNNLYSTVPDSTKLPNKNHKLVYKDDRWMLKSKISSNTNIYAKDRIVIPGVSVWNFLRYNIIWPNKEWLAHEAMLGYLWSIVSDRQPTDIHVPNVIFGCDGISIVDDYHRGAPFNISEALTQILKVGETINNFECTNQNPTSSGV